MLVPKVGSISAQSISDKRNALSNNFAVKNANELTVEKVLEMYDVKDTIQQNKSMDLPLKCRSLFIQLLKWSKLKRNTGTHYLILTSKEVQIGSMIHI